MTCLALVIATASADQDFRQGVEALRAKKADVAIRYLQRAADADPRCVDCRWELGWAYYLKGDWSQVVSAWHEVKALDPRHPEITRHLPAVEAFLKAEQAAATAAVRAPASAPATSDATVLRLRAVGDVMLGTSFPKGYLPPDDGAQSFFLVRDWLSDADLTFANLEGPLCDDGETRKCGPGQNCYAFRSPTRYGAYLKDAGIDLVSTANNHAEDFGLHCRRVTEKTLQELGVAYSGRPGTTASLQVNGLRVAMIGFHAARTGHYLNDHDTAAALVAGLKADHDLVIVSFHGGAEGAKALHVPKGPEEFYGEKRGDLRRFSRRVIDAGADLVLGHGPHVLRGMEVYRGHLIAYSLGNFATYGRFNLSGYLGVGAVLEVQLDREGRFVGGKILPTRQVGKGLVQPDPKGRAIDLIRRLSRKDFGENSVQVARDGGLLAPTP